MASLRLRRSLILSSSLLKHHPLPSIPLPEPHRHHPISSRPTLRSPQVLPPSNSLIPSLCFRSTPLSSLRRSNNADDEKISPDTILFEGCDYNHWLITMDFPKDPKPTPEEMVETYVQTLAKVVGSVEEAKKSMYACSTTTYTGFQAVMTEEMSEKFRGLPGVVFILPDSYIDPVNKEYGGDKYINGTIIPRPPPVQYGRSRGRYDDRNRNYDRPRYDRQREPMPMQQGNAPYNQGPMQQGNAPYNQGPMQQGNAPYNQVPMHQGNAPYNQGPMHQGNAPYNQGPMHQGNAPYNQGPMHQGNAPYNQGPMQQGNPPSNQGFSQGDGRNYTPQQNYGPAGQSDGRGCSPPGRDNYQGERRDTVPSYQRDHNQGSQTNYNNQERRNFSQGEGRDYAPPERGVFRGDYQQGAGSGYGQSYNETGEGQRFSQGEPSNFSPVGQSGTGQGQY